MCQWAATNLCSAQCEEPARGESIHWYQDRKIWLCKDAERISYSPEAWSPCRNYKGKHGQEDVDSGSTRNIQCPVCKTCQEAEREYSRAALDAQAVYDRAMAAAAAKRSRAIDNSTMFVTYVSRKHHRHS